jgi:hypothetical protein
MSLQRRLVLLACVTALAAAPLAARQSQTFSRQDADRFRTKLDKITSLGTATARPGGAVSTVMSDTEVNAYLRYHAADQIPAGIVEPTLRALGGGRVSGRAVVDLDAVRTQKKRGWLDPLSYLTGSVPLTASGTLVTSGGVGRFQLEGAELGGVSVPKSLIQELLTYYSRTSENPSGINMDDPFELPAHIREIRVDEGRATVVQ